MRLVTPGGAEVIHTFLINREKAHGRAVFRRHICNGGAVNDWQRFGARAEKFHKFADDLCLAQELGDRQSQISGCHTLAQFACQVNPHDIRGQEINGLPEHSRLGFDAAHAPSHDAQTIDHGRV